MLRRRDCYDMSVYLLALLIGVVAGLRAMTAPAAVAWANCSCQPTGFRLRIAGRPRYGRRRLRRLRRGPSPPVDIAVESLRRGQRQMDKVSLTALGRQHLAAAHDAHSGRSAPTVYGGSPTHVATNPDCPDCGHSSRRSRKSRRGHAAGVTRAGSADQCPHQLGWPPRRSPRHPLRPPRLARARRQCRAAHRR